MSKDYYAVLDLDRDATDEEIKTAYREIVKSNHPDVTGGDPEKTEHLKTCTEAYKVLIDPFRRKMHDQDLPMKSYPLRRPTPQRVWNEVVEVILLRSDRFGPFQRALQAAKPIALEDDKMVVGFSGMDSRNGAYLDIAANQRALLNALKLVVGRQTEFQYIDGDTTADWERVKAAQERIAARAEAGNARYTERLSRDMWDELVARLGTAHNQLVRRQFPQTLANFFCEALSWIEETTQNARDMVKDEEVILRGQAKAIERLASLVDIPPVMVAIELDKRRDSAPRKA